MPAWLEVILLGIIEGITEFLPISSTGHLLLAQQWLSTMQSEVFLVVIQCGAVLAVMFNFQERVRQLAFRWQEPEAKDYLFKLAGAFFITGVGGLALKQLGWELPETAAPVAWATLIGGVLFIAAERGLRGKPGSSAITWQIALAIGAAQLLAAVFPGTSRSGATILVALLLGLDRRTAIEFTFLLGVPTLLAAGALELFSALREGGLKGIDWPMLALGTAVSAVTAFLAVRWLLKFVQTHTFEAFGWYRIALGLAVLWLL
jgi:undecaprenyl-diphosphatase